MRASWIGFACVIAVSFFQLSFPAPALAQAWLPRKDTGNVSLTYKQFHIKHHTDKNATRLDRGVVNAHVASAEVDYGLTRRWAVNLSVPYTTVKYTGGYPHVDEHHNIDDGTYHGGVQDFRFGARYGLLRYTPVVVTPFVEAIVPSHGYTAFAHSALGRGLRELLVGANIGWQGEESFLSNASAQTRISYGFVEKVLGRSHNRTNIDSQFTYVLKQRLAVSALASVTKHHGDTLEWDSTKALLEQWTPEELHHHDQLIKADMFDVGGGLAFRVKGSTSVFATLIHTAWSRNSHPWNTGVIVGVNFRFRTRPPAELPPRDEEEVSIQ